MTGTTGTTAAHFVNQNLGELVMELQLYYKTRSIDALMAEHNRPYLASLRSFCKLDGYENVTDEMVRHIIERAATTFMATEIISEQKDAAGIRKLHITNLERTMAQVLNTVAATPQFTTLPESVQMLVSATLQSVEQRRTM